MDKNVELETKDNVENEAGSNQEEEVVDLFGKYLWIGLWIFCSVFQEDLLQKVNEATGDSTDDEGIEPNYLSDDSVLEFESDEDGNYKSSNKSEDDEDDGEDNADDDSIDEADIEDISGEDDDDSEDEVTQVLEKSQSEGEKQKSTISPSKAANLGKAFNDFGQELDKSKRNKKGKAVTLENMGAYNEYDNSDTSDEEDIRNTVGNIPMHWYDDYKHIGYDWDAKKIIKPPKGDQIDDFLRKIEDPNFWRTVRDPQTGQEVVLTDADIELIKRINSSRVPNPEHNEYEPWIDWFTSEVEKMPIKNVPDHKRSFLPSVSEKKKIGRMVHALKMGWMKSIEELEKEKKEKRGPKFYMLWETDTSREEMRRIHDPVSAPKRDLPGHAESYNPPPEYLFDEKEQKEWLKLKDEPHKRKLHFMPQKYRSLREVPAYSRYLRERFLRCLDLYLCPRARRVKLNIDAEYLIPKLPSPKDLQPFPTVESLVYNGHTDLVRSVSVEPKGEYIVSGSDDKTVKSKYSIPCIVITMFLCLIIFYKFGKLLLVVVYAQLRQMTLSVALLGVLTQNYL